MGDKCQGGQTGGRTHTLANDLGKAGAGGILPFQAISVGVARLVHVRVGPSPPAVRDSN